MFKEVSPSEVFLVQTWSLEMSRKTEKNTQVQRNLLPLWSALACSGDSSAVTTPCLRRCCCNDVELLPSKRRSGVTWPTDQTWATFFTL